MTTLWMIHRTASEDDNVTVDNALPSISTATNNIRPPPAKRRVTHDTHLHLSHNSDLETIPANERDTLFKIRPLIGGGEWYFPLLTNAIDVALVNAHALYCLAKEAIDL